VTVAETIHYCGLIPGADADEAGLRAQLAPLLRPVGCGFGQLAAGADIVAAEMLLDQGAAVTAVLPFPPEHFLEQSVRRGGAAWVPRYRACLERVTLRVLAAAPCDDLDYALASRRAMGLARLTAERQGGRCWQLAIWDRGGGAGPAGTAADVRSWNHAGGHTVVVESPWPRRRSTEANPAEPRRVRTAKAILFGHGIPLVFDDPAEAAVRACELANTAVSPLLLDFAPETVMDIRPAVVMPAGGLHATEAFACEAALTPGAPIVFEPAGESRELYEVRPAPYTARPEAPRRHP